MRNDCDEGKRISDDAEKKHRRGSKRRRPLLLATEQRIAGEASATTTLRTWRTDVGPHAQCCDVRTENGREAVFVISDRCSADEDRGTYDEDVYWGMELWDAARRDIILRRGAGKMQRCVNTLAFKKEWTRPRPRCEIELSCGPPTRSFFSSECVRKNRHAPAL